MASPVATPAAPGATAGPDAQAPANGGGFANSADKARALLKKVNHVLKSSGKHQEGVGKVVPAFVKSLQSCLTSSDQQVSSDAAALLARCTQLYPKVVAAQDLTMLRAKLADLTYARDPTSPGTRRRNSDAALAHLDETVRKATLRKLLEQIIATVGEGTGPAAAADPAAAAPEAAGGLSELVLYVRKMVDRSSPSPDRSPERAESASDGNDRATLHLSFAELKRRFVSIEGVVSATVEERREGSFLVLMCRPHQIALAADGSGASFAERLGQIGAELGFSATLVNKASAAIDHGISAAATTAASETPSAYAEDITDAAIAARFGAGGASKWSFFNTSNCYLQKAHMVVEYEDDPDLAARLAKIKQREAERKAAEEEKQSAVGRFLRAFVSGPSGYPNGSTAS